MIIDLNNAPLLHEQPYPSMFDFNDGEPQADDQVYKKTPVESGDPVAMFLAHMAKSGLNPGVISLDGGLTRFDVDKRGDKVGWYVYHTDGVAPGAFGSWKDEIKEEWCHKDIFNTFQGRTKPIPKKIITQH